MTLQQTQPRARRRLVGRILVACLIIGGGYASLAARADEAAAPGKPSYDILVSLNESDGPAARVMADAMEKRPGENMPHLIQAAGEKFAIEKGGWRAEFVITPISSTEKTFKLAGNITGTGQNFRPVLIGRLGEKMGVSVGGPDSHVALTLLVNEAAPQVKPVQ